MFRHSLPEQCHSPVWLTAHALLPHGATDTSLGSLEESAPVGTGETVSRAPWYSLSSPVPWWPLLLTPAHPFPSRAPVSRKAGSPGKLSCRRARYSISQWDSKAGKNGRGKNKQLKKPKPNKPQTNIILPHQKKKKKRAPWEKGGASAVRTAKWEQSSQRTIKTCLQMSMGCRGQLESGNSSLKTFLQDVPLHLCFSAVESSSLHFHPPHFGVTVPVPILLYSWPLEHGCFCLETHGLGPDSGYTLEGLSLKYDHLTPSWRKHGPRQSWKSLTS